VRRLPRICIFNFERSTADKHISLAIPALALHYVLVFGSHYAPRSVFLPTLLLFLMALTLVIMI
jgi:hypothetical protein